MSAFIVSDKHINTLVTFASSRKVRAWLKHPLQHIAVLGNEQDFAELLLAENTRSVNYRYSESDPVKPIKFTVAPDISAIGIIKACDCLVYQSCETEDWEQTAACALIKAIREEAVHELPGYSEAPWGIR